MIVSVIIPCYNHGMYIEEAIESVEQNAENISYEIIIVNDGSTDEYTINTLSKLEKSHTIIHQKNQGLAAARNNGISTSTGKYILPLDSDNKLHKNYLTEAISILDTRPEIDIVYGKPLFFGDEDGLRDVGVYSFSRILKYNYIDACAIFRRSVWTKVNGYDGKMPVMGHEDWEFWIHSYLEGSQLFYLDKICFYYRVQPLSMRLSTTNLGVDLNKEYIYHKHGIRIIEKLIKDSDALTYIKNNKLKAIIKFILGIRI